MVSIAFIREVASQDYFWEQSAITNAMVNCLMPEDACNALTFNDTIDSRLRRYILKKINSDISEVGFKDFHNQLVNRLIRDYEKVISSSRQSCAYCLNEIYFNCPEKIKDKILNFFISNKHVTTRKRSYKLMQANWDKKYTDISINSVLRR